jgi:GAF domain-containing protein
MAGVDPVTGGRGRPPERGWRLRPGVEKQAPGRQEVGSPRLIHISKKRRFTAAESGNPLLAFGLRGRNLDLPVRLMGMSVELAAALARVSHAASQAETPQDALEAIVSSASGVVPGFDHLGICAIEKQGQVRIRAWSGAPVRDLDRLEDELGEGPCTSALDTGEDDLVLDLRHERRWPTYVREAFMNHGVKSQIVQRLSGVEDQNIGVLNLCSTTRDEIDSDARAVAQVVAAHVSVAVAHALEVGQLRRALDTARSIGMAIGLLMERHQIDRDRAFTLLTRVSQNSNVRLRELAADVVVQNGTSHHLLDDGRAVRDLLLDERHG